MSKDFSKEPFSLTTLVGCTKHVSFTLSPSDIDISEQRHLYFLALNPKLILTMEDQKKYGFCFLYIFISINPTGCFG